MRLDLLMTMRGALADASRRVCLQLFFEIRCFAWAFDDCFMFIPGPPKPIYVLD